jgi:hypothetical protein
LLPTLYYDARKPEHAYLASEKQKNIKIPEVRVSKCILVGAQDDVAMIFFLPKKLGDVGKIFIEIPGSVTFVIRSEYFKSSTATTKMLKIVKRI